MARTVPRTLCRLLDGNPDARLEAALAVLRCCICVFGALALLLTPTRTVLPLLAQVLLACGSLALAVAVTRIRTPDGAARAARWSTAADVAAWTTYTVAFHDVRGAGTLLGLWVLLVGPVRYGVRGVPATVLPVAVVASIWPQQDGVGQVVSLAQTWILCLLFTVPALVVRSVWMHGSSRVRLAEQQFATAFEHASIGMALLDQRGAVVQANLSLADLLGLDPTALDGRHLADLTDTADRGVLSAALHGLTDRAPSTHLEVRLRHADGGLRWGNVSAARLTGRGAQLGQIVVQVENITERHRSQAMLAHAAAHDALTDLPNRTTLLLHLDSSLAAGEQVGVLFLDLDRFKVVNDGLGHAAGDLLLVRVAVRLREAMRAEDVVARIGGDEFVVLVRQADEALCRDIAQRVLNALACPVERPGGGDLAVGASIGITLAAPGDTAETLLRDADTAMYAAKARGGGRGHVFTPELREAVVRAHELEVDLRAAVRAGALRVAYQPVYDLRSGQVTGVEALARWEDQRGVEVSSAEFIAVAEQSDLILELGDWVLAQALSDAAGWPLVAGRAAVVSVNVSLRQLVSDGFVARVEEQLCAAGLEPDRLCLEVTETVLVGDVDTVVAVLTDLRDLGVHLSIDDFGTGHASLTYLARFPVDQVKIDRSFVAGLGDDAGSAAIVGGVVAMAHTFDMRVVAEGVETEEQLAALRAIGCDGVQGFVLARPVDNEQLSFLLRRRSVGALVPAARTPDGDTAPVSNADLDRQRLLVDGARLLTGRLDVQAVLDHALDALGSVVSLTGGALLMVDGDQVRILAGRPAPTLEALAARIPVGQGVAGGIVVSGDPRYLPDITIASTVPAGRRRASSSSGVRSWFGVPLVAEGRVIGVLQIDSTRVDAFSENERLAVLSFAPVVTLALASARRVEDGVPRKVAQEAAHQR